MAESLVQFTSFLAALPGVLGTVAVVGFSLVAVATIGRAVFFRSM